MKNTMTVSERYAQASNANQLTMADELEIIDFIVNKYNFKSVAQYAKEQNISNPAALKRISTGKIMYLEMIGRKFIIN